MDCGFSAVAGAIVPCPACADGGVGALCCIAPGDDCARPATPASSTQNAAAQGKRLVDVILIIGLSSIYVESNELGSAA
jgi:hypothetical protein